MATATTQNVVLETASRDSGTRNAKVTLYTDRIERVKPPKRMSLSRSHLDVEVTPVKAISSVQIKKDGLACSLVTVYATGNTIEFRMDHKDAAKFKDELMRLVLAQGPAPAAAPASGAAEVARLADLHAHGSLTDEEFTAAKKAALGL